MKLRQVGIVVGFCAIAVVGIFSLSIGLPKDDKTIAEYEGGTIGKKEHDAYLRIMQLYTPGIAGQLEDPKFNRTAVLQNIAFEILAARGRNMERGDQRANAEKQWEEFKKQYASIFSSNGESLQDRMLALRLTEAEAIRFYENQIYGDLYLKSTLKIEDLKRDYKLNADRHYFDRFDLNRIFIANVPKDSQIRTKAEALARAEEVAEKLRDGGSFADLAAEYSDLPVTRGEKGLLTDVPLYEIDSDIHDDILMLPLNEISKPLEAEGGYYVIRINRKSTITYDEATEMLKESYVRSIEAKFMSEELPGLIINLD
ncbi:peptidylprolyl isomerase [Cohnella endophytica]|uniref:peptidylprolyl isomerase n=1 Tax=Cohnella endophytica TaxID=2419778 RepID=UPI0013148592|nr:peptidylprolyl isomerase [Cohnella endophytica]